MRRTSSLVLLLLVGCSGKDGMPKTYPVKGKVFDAKGGPLNGGLVQFRSPLDTTLSVVGTISTDGSFSLRTLKDRGEASGAPEGEYQVTIAFPIPEGEHAPPPPATLSTPAKVEAKENTLELRLEQ